MTRIARIAAAFSIALLSVSAGTPASAQSAPFDGEVTKIDPDASKITIKHGPMKKFDMDVGMTMVFKAADPAMLKQVKAGDRIKIDADKVNGQFTVVKIEPKE